MNAILLALALVAAGDTDPAVTDPAVDAASPAEAWLLVWVTDRGLAVTIYQGRIEVWQQDGQVHVGVEEPNVYDWYPRTTYTDAWGQQFTYTDYDARLVRVVRILPTPHAPRPTPRGGVTWP